MDREKFNVLVTGLVTNQGKVLIGKKIEKEGHPVSGEWHLPGGFMEDGEDPRETLKREMEEEADIEVEIHQIVDIEYAELPEAVRVYIHCEAESDQAEAGDDLQETKWVEPSEVGEYLETDDGYEREEIQKFLEKLKKMPSY